MGDPIEFTTIPGERTEFFKVSSGGLKVEIKGERSAAIGLQSVTDELEDRSDYVIVLDQSRCFMFKQHFEMANNVPNLLSPNEYRGFWVLWDSQSIRLGRHGDRNPILVYRSVIEPLNYVSFGSNCDDVMLNWKFEVPPEIPRPIFKPLVGGGPRWVNVGDQLPHGVINGGFEDGNLYIIRARHRGSLTPGKFVSSEGLGYISWGGEAHEKEEFEILVGYNFAWVPTSDNKIPVGAVVGGYTEDNPPQELFVGRARHLKRLIPGKVQPSHSVCYVPYGGKECAHSKFEVLVSLETNNRFPKKNYGSTIFYAIPPTMDDDDIRFEDII